MGSLQNRAAILDALQDLPQAHVATEGEIQRFIQQNAGHGMGIGYIDTHLLAAVRRSPGSALWTRDKRLLAAGRSLGLAENVVN